MFLPETGREKFTRALEPFLGLMMPEATTSD